MRWDHMQVNAQDPRYRLIALVFAGWFFGCGNPMLHSGRAITFPSADELERYVGEDTAVEAFRDSYWEATGKKAFASSEDGAWGWSSGKSSVSEARDAAWVKCQEYVGERHRPCRIVNVDGSWDRPSSDRKITTEEMKRLDQGRWLSALSLREWELYCAHVNEIVQRMLPQVDSCEAGPLGPRTPIISCVPRNVPLDCRATVGQMIECSETFTGLLVKNWCDLQQRRTAGFMADFASILECYAIVKTCSNEVECSMTRDP